MNWSQTRRRFVRLGRRGAEDSPEPAPESSSSWSVSSLLRSPEEEREPVAEPDGTSFGEGVAPACPRAASVCVASGKGGTGKSVLTASLASLLGARGRTLIVDTDLGVGNAHILQDVSPSHSFVDVVDGNLTVREVLVSCGGQLDLVAAGSGVPRMADLNAYERHLIATGLADLETDYRYLVCDSAAGVSRQTVTFAEVSDVVVLVTTPDLTALTDAYAFLKVLHARQPERVPLLVVNRARSAEEAEEAADRILRVCRRFLDAVPRLLGWLPDDDAVQECVNQRGPAVLLNPHCRFSRELRRLAVAVLEELGRQAPQGFGLRLLREVGYSPRVG